MVSVALGQHHDSVMGFSQEKTTHHFRILKDGGAIEVTAKDVTDAASRDQIRMHLGHIAKMFAAGDFKAPMLVHDKVPPGVPVLARLKGEVEYRFEEMERGGAVRISPKNAEALKALHEFFEISDCGAPHGGSVEVKGRRSKGRPGGLRYVGELALAWAGRRPTLRSA